MVADRYFIPGDFYRIDDRTGFKTRAGKTRKEWNGRIVRNESFEMRHPQDFVTGVRDDQTVPEPRPRQIDQFQGPLGTTLAATIVPYAPGPTFLRLDSRVRFFINDILNVMQDNGEMLRCVVIDVPASPNNVVQIDRQVAFKASSGNVVINVSAESDPVIEFGGEGLGSGDDILPILLTETGDCLDTEDGGGILI